MIARQEVDKAGERAIRYIPLRLQTRIDDEQVWIPIGGGVCGFAEVSRAAAVRACIRSLDARFGSLQTEITEARASRQRCYSDPDDRGPLAHIQVQVARLRCEAVRLLDAPTANDVVDIAAELSPPSLTPHQLRAARIMTGLGLREIAKRSGRALSAIQAIESGSTRRPRPSTIASLQAVFTAAGVEFDAAGWVRYRGKPATVNDTSSDEAPTTFEV